MRVRLKVRWTPPTCSNRALARGELRCVGATTLNEYRKYIEKDAALERRFQPVLVTEPTVEDTIAIFAGVERALRGTSWRADQGFRHYCRRQPFPTGIFPTGFLPDKAVDLIDEAASRLRIELDSMPSEIDAIDRKIIQLEIELQSLKNDTDEPAVERRGKN